MNIENNGKIQGQKFIKLLETRYKRSANLFDFEQIKFGASQLRFKKYFKTPHEHHEFIEFLSVISPNKPIDLGVVKIGPDKDMIGSIHDFYQLFQYDRNLNLIPFATWTGESDGDVWAYDVNDKSISSIPAGLCEADYSEMKSESYAYCKTLEEWRIYLIKKLIKWEFFHEAELQDLKKKNNV